MNVKELINILARFKNPDRVAVWRLADRDLGELPDEGEGVPEHCVTASEVLIRVNDDGEFTGVLIV